MLASGHIQYSFAHLRREHTTNTKHHPMRRRAQRTDPTNTNHVIYVIYMGGSQGRCPRKGVRTGGQFLPSPILNPGKSYVFENFERQSFFVFSATSGDPGEPPNDQKITQSPKVRPRSPQFLHHFPLIPSISGISCISPWWVQEQNHRGPVI